MAPRSSAVLTLDTLQDAVSVIFDQVQVTTANHRKNCVALYKLHVQAGTITQSVKAGIKLVGERLFGDVFIDMASRVVVVKKGPATADRTIKFIGVYIRFMNEKASELKAKRPPPAAASSSSPGRDEDDETLVSRFVARVLKWLLPGFVAKNKNVRFRCVHIVSEMISHLGELDEDLYNSLRHSLIERVCDKESLIRAHAVVALSKLVGSEDLSELGEDEQTILDVLLDILCFDPAAEVRRAALLHIPLTPSTLSTVLTRTRDVDAVTRKLVYSAVLQTKLEHPRQLSIVQREQVVKDGLGDREPSVRVAAGKMVGAWFDMILAEGKGIQERGAWVGDDGGIMRGLVQFLEVFDVIGGESIAVDAILSIFVTRANLLDVFTFDEHFWTELTPESALLARVYMEHCITLGNDAYLESASIPVVTAFAFYMQEAYNVLLSLMQEEEEAKLLGDDDGADNEESDRREEDMARAGVVLAELLRIAVKLDYADEIGRRKVFSVIRDMLGHEQIPPTLIEWCLDVLAKIAPTERELIRVVVEVVLDLRDEGDSNILGDIDLPEICDDESQSDVTQTAAQKERSMRRTKERHEMTTDEGLMADLTDMRCLTLCIGMLERVHGTFEDNSTLEGILSDLIIPAVKRKELAMREKGLISLGLCCLIAKNMALSSFQLFISQVQSSPTDLKLKVLQVIFDLLIVYEQDFFGRSADVAQRIITFLLQTLEAEESNTVQAVLCVGISKLLLSGLVTDSRMLTSLILAYVSPATADNQELRQCLSYFFPAFCYSSPSNQSLMQSVFMTVYDLVTSVHEELDEDQTMITPHQLGMLLIDWTNPQKAANVEPNGEHSQDVHVDIAIDILKAMYTNRPGDDQVSLCQLLGHLYIPPGLESRSLLKLHILLSCLEQSPIDDPAFDRTMNRFKSRFVKIFSADLESLEERQYLKDQEIRDLYEFIGVNIPDEPESETSVRGSPGPRVGTQEKGRQANRRSSGNHGQQTEGSTSGDDVVTSPTPSSKMTKTKGRRTSTAAKHKQELAQSSPEPLDDEEDLSPSPVPATPRKNSLKRVRTSRSKSGVTSPLNKKRTRTRTRGSGVSSDDHCESSEEDAP